MRKMNVRFAYRIMMLLGLSGGFSFLSGCGSSSGGGEKEFEFNATQMVDKQWYRNVWIDGRSGENYELKDGLEVVQFDADGKLRMIELSGQRDEVVGRWDLDGNELTFDYDEKEDEVWYVVSPSDEKYLKLQSDASKEYFASVADLDDVSADARIIRETYNDNGYKQGFRYDFQLKASNVTDAWVLTKDGQKYILEADASGQFVMNTEQAKLHLENYSFHEEMIRFVLKFKSGLKTILNEYIYANGVEPLEHSEVLLQHGAGADNIDISWSRLTNEEGVYYQVQLLDENKDENHPIFVSAPLQFQDEANFTIKKGNTSGLVKEWERLNSGSVFYVKVLAFNFEPGIDFYDENSSLNRQAQSQFIKAGGEW